MIKWLPVLIGLAVLSLAVFVWLTTAGHARLSEIVLVSGIILSLAAGYIVNLAQTARAKSVEAKTALLKVLDEMVERRHAEEALKISETNLANTQRIARIGNWDWDILNNTMRCSDETCNIFGADRQKFTDTFDAFLGYVHPEDIADVRKAVNDTLYKGTACSIDHRIVLPDNSIRAVHEEAEVIFNRDGNPVRMFGIVQDITQRKLAEEELNKHRERLEELVEERTEELMSLNKQLEWEIVVRRAAESAVTKHAIELERSNSELEIFAYVASHDLQEPLRIVAGYAQLLARRYKGKMGADADEFIAHMVSAAVRMQTLINDLLAYSRLGSSKMEYADVDCERVFANAVNNLMAAIAEKGAAVTHDPLPSVFANAVQLEQVLTNLINNAIKYNNNPAPRAHVSASRRENEWLFSVADNGIGIDPKYFDRIFIIFQRLHGKAEYSGTGIGLAICKKIVENHGGRISVESQPGHGATFHFTIPDKKG